MTKQGLFRLVILGSLGLVAVGYNACGNSATFGFGQLSGTIAPNPLTHDSAMLLDAICTELSQCNPSITIDACHVGVLGAAINSQFGAPASYPNFATVTQAEQSGALTGSQTATNTCVSAISTLSCSDPTVQGAYANGAANPFAGVANMIPAVACGQVFSNAQTYEYIYLGDQNVANLPGYSINMSSGILTPIANTASAVAGYLSVGKISSDTQMLLGSSWAGGYPFWIDPTTGTLTAVSGAGFLSGLTSAGLSPSGNYIYSLANTQANAWIASLNSSGFSNAVKSANFPSPVNRAKATVVSPKGDYVYFYDTTNSAIAGYSTSGGALTSIGVTLLPSPNAGAYTSLVQPYLDSSAGVIYLVFMGASGTDNNWIVPYKINTDGSLGAGTPLNIGPNPATGDIGAMVGDSTGKYLFVALPGGTVGINTYTIGSNGSLTYSSGPLYAGLDFYSIAINSENSLLIGNSTKAVTASINMATGVLTPVSSVADPCGNQGPVALDPSEKFFYTTNKLAQPNTICGFTVSPNGAIGAISGQSYPLAISGSNSILSSAVVQMKSP